MEVFLMQLFNGISVSSILLLAALGLAITFGLMGVINMAHGEFIMTGAYTAYVVQNLFQAALPAGMLDWYCPAAIILSFLTAAVLGYVLERLVICRLYGRTVDSLLVTWGISLILQQAARSIFGSPNVGVKAPSFLEKSLRITGMLSLPYKRLFILVIAIVCLVGVYLLMYKTRQGRNIRAVMQNRDMAASLGGEYQKNRFHDFCHRLRPGRPCRLCADMDWSDWPHPRHQLHRGYLYDGGGRRRRKHCRIRFRRRLYRRGGNSI